MDLAIITSGFLPVPASKGGAVENLVVNIIEQNEIFKRMNITIFSVYEEEAVKISKKYSNTKFEFIKINYYITVLDKIIFFIAKKILNKKNAHSYRYILQRLYYLNRVSKLLKINNYEKILLENHPTQYLALKWRKNYIKYKDRYYYHCHNEFPGTYGCSNLIRQTKKIICVSQFIADSIKKFMDMPNNKFIVLRNCIDTNKFKIEINEKEKSNLKKKYGIDKNEKVILFTGRITPEKGVKELIESLKFVEYPKYKLLILGAALFDLKTKTIYEKEIEELVNQLNDKVIFTGYIKYDSINEFYSIADIAVLPSIWNDPAPLTIIESLVCGLPIITTNSGGIPEYAKNGSAIILDRDDKLVYQIAKSIDYLLNDDQKTQDMSDISKKVSEDLTLEIFYNNFLKMIMEN